MQQTEETTTTTSEQAPGRMTMATEQFSITEQSGERLVEVAHDARNMVTALGLYCDLLKEPGVLSPDFGHYGDELQILAAASRRVVEKLMALRGQGATESALGDTTLNARVANWNEGRPAASQAVGYWEKIPATLIHDMAFELQSSRNLLSALAGPGIALNVDAVDGALPVAMTSEDLTRILVNLLKNAVEAMPTGGKILLSLRESPAAPGEDPWLVLNIEDNGPGIATDAVERVFEPGCTTRTKPGQTSGGWRGEHMGLGLSITRSIVEAAGGRIHAANRDPTGACFQIELPVRTA